MVLDLDLVLAGEQAAEAEEQGVRNYKIASETDYEYEKTYCHPA
jgi:hypothetical protein